MYGIISLYRKKTILLPSESTNIDLNNPLTDVTKLRYKVVFRVVFYYILYFNNIIP